MLKMSVSLTITSRLHVLTAMSKCEHGVHTCCTHGEDRETGESAETAAVKTRGNSRAMVEEGASREQNLLPTLFTQLDLGK